MTTIQTLSKQLCRATAAALLIGALLVSATPVSATSYPTAAVTLGTMGATPSHPNGWWVKPYAQSWYSDKYTSFCRYPGTFPNGEPRPTWGLLTHPQGYEITPGGYGQYAYKMYDASIGWIRAANLWFVGSVKPTLVAPGLIDRCGVPPGARDDGSPPPEEEPPQDGPGGNGSIVGTYSCNIPEGSREDAQVTELHERGTLTITPPEGEPREGTWWSLEEDSVFISFQDETVRFTIERDRLAISGFVCNLVDPPR